MSKELYQYIFQELKRTTHPKYYKYIDSYISNLTNLQIAYWIAWMRNKLNPYYE